MHDGAPAHFSRAVRHVLNNMYHDQGIGRGGPIVWSAHSTPHVNPLDLHLWVHLKTFVCEAPLDSEEALQHRIVDACQTIRNYPGIFEWIQWPMTRRVEVCVIYYREHFEHLL
jgi:hypothetical protein